MRKAERLFQIITLLRGRRTVITAKQIAQQLEVSERTVYRDIQALILSGMPIESEAGIGYRLQPKFDVPALMFNPDELDALLLGARMVQGFGSEQLAKSAASALNKIHSVLPEQLHRQIVQQDERLLVPNWHLKEATQYSDLIRLAIKQHLKLALIYQDEKLNLSERTVLPLGLIFWGRAWTLVAWCEKRSDYRLFRLDRITQLTTLTCTFSLHQHCSLQHYMQLQTEQCHQ
ncbi:helix-turn-helix transcriptional regulator [Pseudoalteromonas tunicata]|jgi:predicted DNA-binding transcriptional regulator YafY|uniref:Predicted transcriptional regulator n=1 Tax=Pseudoalteromonas tunicata D2 TaxID=87626 RepID=A4C3H1_9GAMM|nr:YafY family protein [Pseudoalteromonas tunicata]ATC96616.1 hypothetical protein PTUN_b0176 [Pseudoalteromonas tunicata]AXT32795.1 YafY family transcriptional regulator [Pseudoalteromonas tunicata]EAR30103.1 predicted transcriptional regulator [Pseudoalteromonas tunicata D2]MDP4982472.1 YafY family transcriptional regulator [Pseudoalteromonas tunicata]MDP5214536.1 YafY family protein [Pseudoalteromonas tunicata]